MFGKKKGVKADLISLNSEHVFDTYCSLKKVTGSYIVAKNKTEFEIYDREKMLHERQQKI